MANKILQDAIDLLEEIGSSNRRQMAGEIGLLTHADVWLWIDRADKIVPALRISIEELERAQADLARVRKWLSAFQAGVTTLRKQLEEVKP